MSTLSPAAAVRQERVGAFARRHAYVALVGVMMAIVVAGFWPFWQGMFSGGVAAHPIIYVHAAVFSGWMLLLLTQVLLVARRRTGLHRRVGRAGIYYGVLVLALGVAVTIAAPVQHVAAERMTLDEAAGFLILPIGDMLLFGGFFAAGIAYRRRREVHKRLMLLATIALLFAPAARLGGDSGPLAILAIWLFPLALAIAYDVVARRTIERVYIVGVGVLLVAFGRVALMESEAWLVAGRWLLGRWLPAA